VLLDTIAVDDTPESHRLIIEHLKAATTNADRVSALLALNRSSAPDRRRLLEVTYEKWHDHLSGYANYLRIISSGTRNDVFDMIEAEKERTTFDINQPTWSRALLLPMAMNNKMLWTDEGISWMTNTIVEVSAINPYTTGRLLNTFQHVGKLKPPLKAKVTAALESILTSVSEENCPSVYGQAKSYLGRS
jgi:aminopeptidase N